MKNSNRHFHIVVPQLIPTLQVHPTIKLNALSRLLKQANQQVLVDTDYNQLFFDQFNLTQEQLPVAAITGLVDKLPVQNDYWLRADFVELKADLATVYLLGNQHLHLSTDEKRQLQKTINTFFSEDKIKFHITETNRAYCQLKKVPNLKAVSPDAMIGQTIDDYLSTQTCDVYWRRLFAELQMLLYIHPVNQQRQQSNLPQANALWFWGAGRLPQPTQSSWQIVWADHPLVRGLAELHHKSLKTIPANFSDCLMAIEKDGDYLIAFDENFANISEDNIKALEENWFIPLLDALKKSLLTSLTLYLGDAFIYTITQKTSWHFWRKWFL